MAIDSNQLEGLVVENPSAEVRDSARLLKGFLDALLSEQNGKAKKNSRNTAHPAHDDLDVPGVRTGSA